MFYSTVATPLCCPTSNTQGFPSHPRQQLLFVDFDNCQSQSCEDFNYLELLNDGVGGCIKKSVFRIISSLQFQEGGKIIFPSTGNRYFNNSHHFLLEIFHFPLNHLLRINVRLSHYTEE